MVTLDGQRLRIATAKGEPKDDPNFGMTEVYHASTTATVPAELLPEKGRIVVSYQGCGENTICYPPIAKTVDLVTLLIAEAPDGNEAVNSPGAGGAARYFDMGAIRRMEPTPRPACSVAAC